MFQSMLIYKRGSVLDTQYPIAHCISADCAMKKGLALSIKQKFGRISRLKRQKAAPGQIAVLKCGTTWIINLVTKSKFYEKPTPDTLHSSLVHMKHFMNQQGLRLVCIPKIATGRDKMPWSLVEQLLKNVFDNSNILIIVHTL